MGTTNRSVGTQRSLLATVIRMIFNSSSPKEALLGMKYRYSLDTHYRTIRSTRGTSVAENKRAAKKLRNIRARESKRSY